MKKNILLFTVFAVLIAGSTFAQKCKFDYDKTDAFSGEKEQRIIMKFGLFSPFVFSFYHKGEDCRLEVYITMSGEQNFILRKGSKLDIKLVNGKIFNLESVDDAAPTSYVGGSANSPQIKSNYSISYKISKEQLKEISDAGIQITKTHLQGDSYYDHEMKSKDIEKTKSAASCMTNH